MGKPAPNSQVSNAEIVKFRAGERPRMEQDALVREEPLEIRVRGQSIVVTMRTPGHDEELAAGFLVTEGLIRRRNDVVEIAPCLQTDVESAGNVLNVFLAPTVEVDLDRLTRHVFVSSSCGVCGKGSIEAVQQSFLPVQKQFSVSLDILIQLPDRCRSAQATFDKTGGLHAAALFDLSGNLIVLREDVGRHNAVDKVIGHAFLQNVLPLDGHILFVSGRASFEILQKALAAGIGMIAAVSAPSSLAVEFAGENGQTLIGFLRGASFNVYAHPERLLI